MRLPFLSINFTDDASADEPDADNGNGGDNGSTGTSATDDGGASNGGGDTPNEGGGGLEMPDAHGGVGDAVDTVLATPIGELSLEFMPFIVFLVVTAVVVVLGRSVLSSDDKKRMTWGQVIAVILFAGLMIFILIDPSTTMARLMSIATTFVEAIFDTIDGILS